MTTVNSVQRIRRGRLTIPANALLACVVVLRYLTLGYFIIGMVVKLYTGMINDNMIDALDQMWIHGLPFGRVLNGLVLTLICLLPVYFLSGFIGLMGGFCRNKLLLYIHVIFNIILIMADIVFLVFFILLLANHVNGNLRNEFQNLFTNFNKNHLDPRVNTSMEKIFSSLQCCGVTGEINNNVKCGVKYTGQQGCYDKIGSLLDQYSRSYIAMLCLSIFFEIGSIIFSDAIYRKMQNREIKQQKHKEHIQQQTNQDGHTTANGDAVDVTSNRAALLPNKTEVSGCSGMFFDLCKFLFSSFKRNTLGSFIVAIKVLLIVLGGVLVIHGVTFYYSDIISNTNLNDVFDYLYFSGYQLRDILRGIAVSSITFGTLTMALSIFGLLNTCFEDRSKTAIYAGFLIFLIVAKVLVVCLWSTIFSEMLWKMYDELLEQFGGFRNSSNSFQNFKSWNFFFTLFSCCGLRYPGDFEKSGFSNPSEWPKSCCKNEDTRSDSMFYFSSEPKTNCSEWGQGCVSAILAIIKTTSGVLVAILLLILILEIILLIYSYKRFSSQEDFSDESRPPDGMWKVFWSKFTLSDERQKITIFYWICHIVHMLFGLTFVIIGIACIYDKVFHHWKINELLSQLSFAGHNFPYLLLCFTSVIITIGVLAVFVSFIALFIPNFVLPDQIPFVVGKFVRRLTSRVFLSIEMICIILFIIANIISCSLWIAVKVQIDWNMNEQLNFNLISYKFDGSKGLNKYISSAWNTLFKTGECCGTSNYFSLQNSSWYTLNIGTAPEARASVYQQIPSTCCKSQQSSRFEDSVNVECTNATDASTYYTTGCTSALLTRLNYYSISYFVFVSAIILIEILLIISTDRVFKYLKSNTSMDDLTEEQQIIENYGLFSRLGYHIANNRWINPKRMTGFRALVIAFIVFNICSATVCQVYGIGAMVIRFQSWMSDGILHNLYSLSLDGQWLYNVAIGLMYTTFISSIVLLGVLVFGVVAILRLSKRLLVLQALLIFLWIPLFITMLGLLSFIFRLVYDCVWANNNNNDHVAKTYHTNELNIENVCGKTNTNIMLAQSWVLFSFLILIITIVIVELIFIDRLYQRLNRLEEENQQGKGLFKETWDKIFGRWINEENMPGFTKIVTVFCLINMVVMLIHLVFGIGALRVRYLPWMEHIIDDLSKLYTEIYQLGELLSGIMISVFVVSICVYSVTCIWGIAAVLRRSKVMLSVLYGTFFLWIPINLTFLAFLTYLFRLVTNCRTTSASALTGTYNASVTAINISCFWTSVNLVDRYSWVLFTYIIFNLIFMVVMLILTDRIYLRINRSDQKSPVDIGLSALIWTKVFGRWINKRRMPGYSKIVTAFCILNLVVIPVELFFGIGAAVLRNQPFMTDEVLPNLDDLFTGIFQLGGIALGIMVGACIFCILHSVIHLTGIIVILRLSKRLISMYGVINCVWVLVDVIFLVFLSYMFHFVYDCGSDNHITSMNGTYWSYKPFENVVVDACSSRHLLLSYSWSYFSYIIFNLICIALSIILEVIIYKRITIMGSIRSIDEHELTETS